jgi:CTP synthase
MKRKIALFCNVDPRQVIAARDVSTIYEVPLVFSREGLDDIVLELLNLPHYERDLSRWEALVSRVKHPKHRVRVGIVGKYVELPDSYKSLNEALMHGGIANDAAVELVYIDAEELEGGAWPREMAEVDCLLVPIGFGSRGTEGKIRSIRYARENRVPFFGICLGMQCTVIEYARNVCGIKDATSSEFDAETEHAVIYKLRDLLGVEELGGTMRVGAYPCKLKEGTLARKIYGAAEISERHRHRYEVNQKYLSTLVDHGLVISGLSPDGKFVEMVELPDHPWFLGCQFHPEYKSKPTEPHPLFVSYIGAALKAQSEKNQIEARELAPAALQAGHAGLHPMAEGPPSTSEPVLAEEVPSEVQVQG